MREPTIYRRHNCAARHRTSRAMAKCIWPRAAAIIGDGPFGSVSYCRRPELPGDQTTVYLYATLEAAAKAVERIDSTGCGGSCSGNHRLAVLPTLLK